MLIDNPKTGKALLNCPRNVTSTHLLDNMKEAAFTSLHEIESEARDIWHLLGGAEHRRSLLFTLLFIVKPLGILRYERLDGSYKKQKQESGIIHLQSQNTLLTLHCFIETKAQKQSHAQSNDRLILGCASSSVTGPGYILLSRRVLELTWLVTYVYYRQL